MIPVLLWIIGFYAAAAAWAHWTMRRGGGKNRRHYVLVAGNHQMQIEWYVRALQQFSRRTGTDIGITVVLDHSSDETGAIMERFSRRESGIVCVKKSDGAPSRESAFAGVSAGESTGAVAGAAVQAVGEEGISAGAAVEAVGGAGAGSRNLGAGPGEQVVWVELGRKDDVARLPL